MVTQLLFVLNAVRKVIVMILEPGTVLGVSALAPHNTVEQIDTAYNKFLETFHEKADQGTMFADEAYLLSRADEIIRILVCGEKYGQCPCRFEDNCLKGQLASALVRWKLFVKSRQTICLPATTADWGQFGLVEDK